LAVLAMSAYCMAAVSFKGISKPSEGLSKAFQLPLKGLSKAF